MATIKLREIIRGRRRVTPKIDLNGWVPKGRADSYVGRPADVVDGLIARGVLESREVDGEIFVREAQLRELQKSLEIRGQVTKVSGQGPVIVDEGVINVPRRPKDNRDKVGPVVGMRPA